MLKPAPPPKKNSGGLSAVRGWGIISAIMIFRPILLASALAWGVSSIARPLNGGWRADGAPVTLPHGWNVADGTDGEGARDGLKGLVAFDHKTVKPAYELCRREWSKPDEK